MILHGHLRTYIRFFGMNNLPVTSSNLLDGVVGQEQDGGTPGRGNAPELTVVRLHPCLGTIKSLYDVVGSERKADERRDR